MKSKKQLIIMVLNELNVNSDEQNPLTQTQIAKTLSDDEYACDRKTICRNIKFLREMGYPIVKTTAGFYMQKSFFLEDIAFVKMAILSAEGKSDTEKSELAKKVFDVLTKIYKRNNFEKAQN